MWDEGAAGDDGSMPEVGVLLTFLRKLVPEALLLRPTSRAWL